MLYNCLKGSEIVCEMLEAREKELIEKLKARMCRKLPRKMGEYCSSCPPCLNISDISNSGGEK